jgi:hypothetical protein
MRQACKCGRPTSLEIYKPCRTDRNFRKERVGRTQQTLCLRLCLDTSADRIRTRPRKLTFCPNLDQRPLGYEGEIGCDALQCPPTRYQRIGLFCSVALG